MDAFIIILIFIGVAIVTSIFSSKSKGSLLTRIRKSFGKKPYYTDYELSSIKSYWEYAKDTFSESSLIDEITWNDLDMDEVFKRINVCNTSVGEERLYQVLHEIDFDGDRLARHEALVAYFENNTQMREQVQLKLLGLGKSDHNMLASYIFDSSSKMLENGFMYNILAFMPIAFAALILLNTTWGVVLLVLSTLVNAVIYFRLKLRLERELSVISYFSSMLYACSKILKDAKSDTEISSLLTKLEKNYTVFKSIKGKVSNKTLKTLSPTEVVAEYFKMSFLTDIRKYNRIINKINKEHEAFHEFYKAFAEIDIAICTLSFRKSTEGYCLPEFIEDNSVEFYEMYHPLVDNAVKNSGAIVKNSIVTGPNASGKSTFIKAVAVNSILAQTINTCMAKSYKLRRSLVMTSMAVRDSLIQGDSYFITEIKSLKRVLDMTEKIAVTCFIDEILRGTNTIERIAASASMLESLSNKNCLCVVASHDIELTKIMEKTHDNYHFSEDVGSEGVSFDFKLKNGAVKTRNAIRLLSFLGYEKSIVDKANAMVEGYIEKGSW